MKLKEIFDQSDTIIEHWPDFEANYFRVGGPCRSAFKSITLLKLRRCKMKEVIYIRIIMYTIILLYT